MSDDKYIHRDWNEIVKFYSSLEGNNASFNDALKAMYLLSKWIGENYVADSIFGFTSLNTLIITQVKPTYPLGRSLQRLEIKPCAGGYVEFTFVDTYKADRQWKRRATTSDVIARLVGFMHQVGWDYELRKAL